MNSRPPVEGHPRHGRNGVRHRFRYAPATLVHHRSSRKRPMMAWNSSWPKTLKLSSMQQIVFVLESKNPLCLLKSPQ